MRWQKSIWKQATDAVPEPEEHAIVPARPVADSSPSLKAPSINKLRTVNCFEDHHTMGNLIPVI